MQEDEKIEEYVTDFDKKAGWKDKFWNFIGSKYFVPIAIVLIAVIAFCLGRVSGLQEKRELVRVYTSPPISLTNNPLNPPYIKGETGQTAAVGASMVGKSESVVASKNSTKYHYPWCAGAKQISDKNKVTFDSIESARAKGYTPASNCKGLK